MITNALLLKVLAALAVLTTAVGMVIHNQQVQKQEAARVEGAVTRMAAQQNESVARAESDKQATAEYWRRENERMRREAQEAIFKHYGSENHPSRKIP